MRQPRSPETSSPAPASWTCVDLVAAHRRRDAGELDRERAAEAAAGVGVDLLDELDVRQRRDQRRARRRVAEAAALVAGAVEGDRPAARRPSAALARRAARAAPRTRPRARARRRARGSPANSSGQACSIVAAHEPESTTIGPSLPASASSVVAATRLASSGKPEFQAGWPQQVCPSGKRHPVAGAPQHAHGRHAGLGPHEVDQAGRHQRDRPARAHRPRSSQRPRRARGSRSYSAITRAGGPTAARPAALSSAVELVARNVRAVTPLETAA